MGADKVARRAVRVKLNEIDKYVSVLFSCVFEKKE